jgi:ABC-type transporter Mla MlaB component
VVDIVRKLDRLEKKNHREERRRNKERDQSKDSTKMKKDHFQEKKDYFQEKEDEEQDQGGHEKKQEYLKQQEEHDEIYERKLLLQSSGQEESLGICQGMNHVSEVTTQDYKHQKVVSVQEMNGDPVLEINEEEKTKTTDSGRQMSQESEDTIQKNNGKNNDKLLRRQYNLEEDVEDQENDDDNYKRTFHKTPRSLLLSSLTTKSGEKLPTHVIIDCSMFSYIDTAGVSQLKTTVQDYESIGVKTYLAGIATHVDQLLDMDNFYKDVPPHHVYITIQDAVHHAQQDQLGYNFDEVEKEDTDEGDDGRYFNYGNEGDDDEQYISETTRLQ